MQELQRIHTGGTIYTVSSCCHFKNYICYMGNFNVVIFQVDPFRYAGTIAAPPDLQQGDVREPSGIVAISMSIDGKLAVATRQGNLFVYTLPNIDVATTSISLDYDGKNQVKQQDRSQSNLFIQLLYFHPQIPDIVFAFEEKTQEVLIINITTNKIYTVKAGEYINVMCLINNYLLMGTALEGHFLCLDYDKFTQSMQQKQMKVDIQFVPINKFQDTTFTLEQTIDRDTIFTTAYLQWLNINYSSTYSIQADPFAQDSCYVVSCWYQGQLLVHQQSQGQKASFLGSRQINIAKCCCFVENNPGMLAIGTSSGAILFVNVTSLLKSPSKYVDDKSLNQQLQMIIRQDETNFSDDEILELIQVTRSGAIIVIRSASVTTLAGTKTILYGVQSNGGFFIYDFTSKSMTYQTQASHTESIFCFLPHPTLPSMYASVSADATVKVWRDSPDGLVLEQQFGQSNYARFNDEGCSQQYKNGAQSGGILDSMKALGPLLCGAWDPRKDSCLMLLGSFKGNVCVCDVWRSNVFAQFPKHENRVNDCAWTTYPKCLGCSVSKDGIGRLYAFESSLSMTNEAYTVESNWIDFVGGQTSMNGCSFSQHDPLLAIACGDGYVRIFDLKLFLKSKQEVANYYAQNNMDFQQVTPVQIGKFSASDRSIFRAVFHPKMKNVIGITCDSGEVKVYRYEYDGANNFKVQCAATLQGHQSNARPIQFHPEIPYICISGSWDGNVIVWNWVQQEKLYQFKLESDVYGLSIHSGRPFELLVSSRDLSIRKLYLKELSGKLVTRSIFSGIINAINEMMAKQSLSTEQLKAQFSGKTNNQFVCNQIKAQLAALIMAPSYKQMKAESKELLQLCGDLSQQTLTQFSGENILETTAKIISVFNPQDSGAKQLLETLCFLQQPYDLFVKDIHADKLAYQEYQRSNGLALTARSLSHMADNLGRHYIKSLTRSKILDVSEEFQKQKFGFYQFTRKLPNNKQEAMKYQFQIGLMFLAASGNYVGVAESLIWAGCKESVFYENIDVNMQKDVDGMAQRLHLGATLTQVQRRLLEAVGIFQATGDEECMHDVINILQDQNLHCVAKMLAYQLKDEPLLQQVSFNYALFFLQTKQPIKAAMELISTNQLSLATQILALSGESALAALCCIACPEDSDPLGMYGCAELCYKNDIDPKLLLKLGRGSGITGGGLGAWYPRWFGFDQAQKYFGYMCEYLKVFGEQKGEQVEIDVEKIMDLDPQRFFNQVLQMLAPGPLLGLMNKLGGQSLQLRYQSANSKILDIVNQYVKRKKQPELCALYNLFRHRTLGVNSTTYEAAFYSNYYGGIHAFNCRLYNTAAFMFSQAEKIAQKYSVGAEIPDVRMRKLLAVYGYSKVENIKDKIKQMDPKFDFKGYWEKIGEESEEQARTQRIFDAIGTHVLRCVITPFDLKCQPMLPLCPVYTELE